MPTLEDNICAICGGPHNQLDCTGRSGLDKEPGWESGWSGPGWDELPTLEGDGTQGGQF